MGKKYISILAACLALASCTEKPQSSGIPGDEGTGVLINFAMKSGESIAASAFDDFTVKIVDKETSEVVKAVKYGELGSSVLPVAPGTYIVLAEDCSEEESETGDGRRRISGRGVSDLEIVDGVVSVSRIECSVTTAKVTVEFSSDFSENFSEYRIIFDDSRGLALGVTAEGVSDLDRVLYWNVPEEGLLLRFRIEGTVKTDGTLKMTDGSVMLKRGKWAALSFRQPDDLSE